MLLGAELGLFYIGFITVVYALMSAAQRADDANDSLNFDDVCAARSPHLACASSGGAARVAASSAFIERGVL